MHYCVKGKNHHGCQSRTYHLLTHAFKLTSAGCGTYLAFEGRMLDHDHRHPCNPSIPSFFSSQLVLTLYSAEPSLLNHQDRDSCPRQLIHQNSPIMYHSTTGRGDGIASLIKREEKKGLKYSLSPSTPGCQRVPRLGFRVGVLNGRAPPC